MATIPCTGTSSSRELEQAAAFLRVISEPNRLKILCLLKNGESCVCEIWQQLQLPQNLTSHHLKVLRDFGLLSTRKDGLNIFYSIDRQTLDGYAQLLDGFLKS